MLSSTSQTVGNYHHAETCVWIIRFPVGKSVNIRFTKFAIEYHPQCNFDYLEMRDGDNAASPLFGKFCGGISPPSFTSSGNTLYIKLVTDDSVSFGGFSMTYSIAPPSEYVVYYCKS